MYYQDENKITRRIPLPKYTTVWGNQEEGKVNESCGLANQTFSDRNDKKSRNTNISTVYEIKKKLSFVF